MILALVAELYLLPGREDARELKADGKETIRPRGDLDFYFRGVVRVPLSIGGSLVNLVTFR